MVLVTCDSAVTTISLGGPSYSLFEVYFEVHVHVHVDGNSRVSCRD